MNIVKQVLPENQYFKDNIAKDTIYLHHTAGSHNPANVIAGWAADNLGQVATAYLIGGSSTSIVDNKFDGKIYQAFDDKCWAYHLGLKASNGIQIAKKSVGIEVCNWGYLNKVDGKYINYVGRELSESAVYDFGANWRGYRFFHRYTNAQLEALKALIIDIANRHSINVKKKWSKTSFEISNDALNGKPGIYTHANVRTDKWDCHPQPELIDMLNTI
jgi:N-acetyl-anhydromuramyl-L-alanine amidase AmpD